MISLTLTSNDLYPHAGVFMPVYGVEFNESGDNGFVKVGVFHAVRVRVTLEYLSVCRGVCRGVGGVGV